MPIIKPIPPKLVVSEEKTQIAAFLQAAITVLEKQKESLPRTWRQGKEKKLEELILKIGNVLKLLPNMNLESLQEVWTKVNNIIVNDINNFCTALEAKQSHCHSGIIHHDIDLEREAVLGCFNTLTIQTKEGNLAGSGVRDVLTKVLNKLDVIEKALEQEEKDQRIPRLPNPRDSI